MLRDHWRDVVTSQASANTLQARKHNAKKRLSNGDASWQGGGHEAPCGIDVMVCVVGGHASSLARGHGNEIRISCLAVVARAIAETDGATGKQKDKHTKKRHRI